MSAGDRGDSHLTHGWCKSTDPAGKDLGLIGQLCGGWVGGLSEVKYLGNLLPINQLVNTFNVKIRNTVSTQSDTQSCHPDDNVLSLLMIHWTGGFPDFLFPNKTRSSKFTHDHFFFQ